MKRDIKKTAFIGLFIFSALFIGSIWLLWKKIEPTIYAFTLTDILNVLLTGFIGILITIVFSVSLNNQQKRFEVLSSILDMYLEDLKYLMSTMYGHKEGKIDIQKLNREVTHIFKMASNDLNSLIEVCRKVGIAQSVLDLNRDQYFALKGAATFAPFVTQDDVISRYDDIMSNYYSIKNSIHALRLTLYK